ncbi:MAG TPA: prepilin-type N-terminal cleavage/methylation domain-containing protein [Phycisphaerales bacterium]|nr:prepilin-type N-terminal cleavage/methylation domain-containing protein [Phycisphaerales bacterium]HMP38124.1 prepilin-type N-terminal cleavage/methylation domain-containing protein [Phycisphaerales bacterium]
MSSRRRRSAGSAGHRRRGITLAETLVALAVLGILLGLALPVLGRITAAGRSAQCASNLRQMIAAAATYATQNGDRYPPAILYVVVQGGVETRAWDWIQAPGGVIRPGPLWAYVGDPDRVQQCPEFHGASTFAGDPHTGYQYNTTYLGTEGFLPSMGSDGAWIDGWANARPGLPTMQHRRTAETAVFADGGWKNGANKFMRAPSNQVENDLAMVYAGGQAFRHSGSCNVAWLDGHCACATTPREGMHATPQLLESIMGWPRNGFLSEDDAAFDPR